MEKVGIFYGQMVFLWPFGNLVALWYIFPRFGVLCLEKSGNPVPVHSLCMFARFVRSLCRRNDKIDSRWIVASKATVTTICSSFGGGTAGILGCYIFWRGKMKVSPIGGYDNSFINNLFYQHFVYRHFVYQLFIYILTFWVPTFCVPTIYLHTDILGTDILCTNYSSTDKIRLPSFKNILSTYKSFTNILSTYKSFSNNLATNYSSVDILSMSTDNLSTDNSSTDSLSTNS
jgi:hypothetical protein